MFGNPMRTLSRPKVGYVCLSCLLKTLEHPSSAGLRFQSTTTQSKIVSPEPSIEATLFGSNRLGGKAGVEATNTGGNHNLKLKTYGGKASGEGARRVGSKPKAPLQPLHGIGLPVARAKHVSEASTTKAKKNEDRKEKDLKPGERAKAKGRNSNGNAQLESKIPKKVKQRPSRKSAKVNPGSGKTNSPPVPDDLHASRQNMMRRESSTPEQKALTGLLASKPNLAIAELFKGLGKLLAQQRESEKAKKSIQEASDKLASTADDSPTPQKTKGQEKVATRKRTATAKSQRLARRKRESTRAPVSKVEMSKSYKTSPEASNEAQAEFSSKDPTSLLRRIGVLPMRKIRIDNTRLDYAGNLAGDSHPEAKEDSDATDKHSTLQQQELSAPDEKTSIGRSKESSVPRSAETELDPRTLSTQEDQEKRKSLGAWQRLLQSRLANNLLVPSQKSSNDSAPQTPDSSPDLAEKANTAPIVTKNEGEERQNTQVRKIKLNSVYDEPLNILTPEQKAMGVKVTYARERVAKKKEKNVQYLGTQDLSVLPLNVDRSPVPKLSYGLDRVLFNPGVYQLQEPRTRVYNFDPYLQTIMPLSEFDFTALNEYITSSKDHTLRDMALKEGKKYVGSSSSMTWVLSHFHFLLSQWREIDTSMLSRGFPDKLRSFTQLQRCPASIFLQWKDGVYAMDADKEFDSANVLMSLGKSMEKLLTLPTQDFERYRKSNDEKASLDEQVTPEAYHYCTTGDLLMRSQLDAHDPRLPGTGMFDLKTRAVVAIRMDTKNYEQGVGYQIKNRFGEYESYEREFFDMSRSAFLKYSLQVRMGRMDGIFVAYHNVERIFGFQYISLPELDQTLHGQSDTTIGNEEFKLSLGLLNKVLDRATAKFPGKSLRMHFETRDSQTPFMYMFAEPVTEEQVHNIQTRKRADIDDYERKILGLQPKVGTIEQQGEPVKDSDEPMKDWEGMHADVEGEMLSDESHSNRTEPTVNADSANTASSADQASTLEDQGPLFSKVSKKASSIVSGQPEPQQSAVIGNNEEVGSDQAKHAAQLPVTNEETGKKNSAVEAKSIVGMSLGEGLEQDSESEADVGFLDEIDREQRETVPSNRQELLAMTLTIRNVVNGKYARRPEAFGPGDHWSVEYELEEIDVATRAWSLYAACQKRRSRQLDDEDDEDAALNYYLRKLRKITEQGRKWRNAQDAIDRDKEKVVI